MSAEGERPGQEQEFEPEWSSGLPNKGAMERNMQRRASPDQLTTALGAFEPIRNKTSQVSATELLREYDGTSLYGDWAISVDINENGEVSPLLTRRATRSGSKYNEKYEQSDIRYINGKLDYNRNYSFNVAEGEIENVVEHVKQEWQ